MPEVTPFVAMSPGAQRHLVQNPLVQEALKQGVFKDIWGSEYSSFMGMDSGGYGQDGEIPDNTQGRTQAFRADVAVYRCVDIRGAAIASVPIKVYDSVDPSKRQEVEHEALDVLLTSNPYGYIAGPQLFRYSLGSRDLHGAFAWKVVYDTGGKVRSPLPRELYWLPPGQYKPIAGKDLRPPKPKVPFAGLQVSPGDGKAPYFLPAEEVVYAPSYNPQMPLSGTSRISALRNDLNLRLYGQYSNLWFFRNNQRPDVVVTGAFSPTIENVGLMRRIWKAAFGGDHNRGPAFLPSDMRVNLLTMTQKDAEWLGQRQAAREDILAAFGVPPPVYGDLARATYENIRTAYEGFWRSGMIPELDEMAWVLTNQFLWKWPDAKKARLCFSFDYQAIEALQEDANAIWERTAQLMDRLNVSMERRALLPNQMRQIAQMLFKQAGLPDAPWKGKVPGGDMFYVRLNDIPVIESSVQANVDALAARAGITGGETNKPGNGQWTLPDARDVVGDPVQMAEMQQAGPTGTPSGETPAPKALPAPKVLIHNHLTRLEWPQLPGLPEAAELGLDHGDQREADTGAGCEPHETVPQLAASSQLHAEQWLTRRLKRHFQDQQTQALRVLRAAHDAPDQDQAIPDPSTLVDQQAGAENVREVVLGALLMAGLNANAQGLADEIESNTQTLLSRSMAMVAGQGFKVTQECVRQIFRVSIDERAQAIARTVLEAGRRQESAA